MKTFGTLVEDYKTLSKDSSSDNETLGETLVNSYLRKILNLRSWSFNTTRDIITTTANTQAYRLPYNCEKVISVKQLNTDMYYFPSQIISRETWDRINQTIVKSDVPEFWFANENDEIELYPTPSAGGKSIYLTHRKRAKDFSASDYTTGTVTVAKGSVYLVGNSTVWTETMVGRHFKVDDDGFWYEIDGYTNSSYLRLKKPFYGYQTNSLGYHIGELLPLPDGFEDLPLWGALAEYFKMRGENVTISNMYEARFRDGLQQLMIRDRRTESAIIDNTEYLTETMRIDPNFPPTIEE